MVVDSQRVQEFLDPLPVGRLWGLGRVAGEAFDRLGVRTIGELRQFPPELLRRRFGESGEHFRRLAHGIDERRVVPDREAKSISHETTFAKDVEDLNVLRAWLLELSEQVGWRLRRHKLRGRTVTIKVRFDDFQTITRSQTLDEPTDITQEIAQTALGLLTDRVPARRLRVRLLGVGISGFENPEQVQVGLFADDDRRRQTRLDETADRLKERFGSNALQRASSLAYDAKHRPAPRPGQSEA